MPVTRTDPQTGETRTWDGGSWVPMAQAGPVPASAQPPMSSTDKPAWDIGAWGMVPGLSDLANAVPNLVRGAEALPDIYRNLYHSSPDVAAATRQGFSEGSSNAMTPGRMGTLGVLGTMLGVPMGLAAATVGGGTLVNEGVKAAEGAPTAPTSVPQAVLRAGEAAAMPLIPAGMQKLGETASLAGVSPNVIKHVLTGASALAGSAAGYEKGGLMGGLVGAGLGTFGGKRLGGYIGELKEGLDTRLAARAALRALSPEVEVGANVPNVSGYTPEGSATNTPEWTPKSTESPWNPPDEGAAARGKYASLDSPGPPYPGMSPLRTTELQRIFGGRGPGSSDVVLPDNSTIPRPASSSASSLPSYMLDELGTELVNAGGDLPVRAQLLRDDRPGPYAKGSPFATGYGPDGEAANPSLDDQYRTATFGLRAPYGFGAKP